MKEIKIVRWLVLLVVFGSLLLLFPLNSVKAANETKIAYVYKHDGVIANSYKSFLETKGYTVDLVHMNDINSTIFSNYDLTIIGSDTSPKAGPNFWMNNATPIMASGPAILGIYSGGALFLDSVGGPGWSFGAYGVNDSIGIDNASHPIFTTPNSISGAPYAQITVAPSDAFMIYNGSIMNHMELLGYFPPSPTYYSVYTWQNGSTLCVEFGFLTSPDGMTSTGKNLFINIVNFLAPSSTETSIPAFNLFYLLLGVLLLIAILQKPSQKYISDL